jgi:hypothetical protein
MVLMDLLRMAAHNPPDISVLILEFEEVLIVATGLMILLIYLFYFRYPVNKDLE